MSNAIPFPLHDAAEEEALERFKIARFGGPRCVSYFAGYRCHRVLGHRGDHVAVNGGRITARWRGAEERPAFG